MFLNWPIRNKLFVGVGLLLVYAGYRHSRERGSEPNLKEQYNGEDLDATGHDSSSS